MDKSAVRASLAGRPSIRRVNLVDEAHLDRAVIGLVAFPCTFLAKLIVERLPVHVHTVMLDAVVVIGGSMMIFGALR